MQEALDKLMVQRTTLVIAHRLSTIKHADAICVVEGGRAASEALLREAWGLVFFTGSERVGKLVAAASARTLTPVVLELGGKSPNIFFSSVAAHADAFFDKAVEVTPQGLEHAFYCRL